MGPHDLLCKWCSTFVGKGKKFCSIFCESRYTRSKRRKLAFKRPVNSSGPHGEKEYESPRSNKTAPARKESFLEDVITAIENDKPSPERDKRRPDAEKSSKSPVMSDKTDKLNGNIKGAASVSSIPKLDLSSHREKGAKCTKHFESSCKICENKENNKTENKGSKEERKKSANLRSRSRSKTHTILVHKNESKIPVRTKILTDDKNVDLNKTEPIKKSLLNDSFKSELKMSRLSKTNEKLISERESTADIYSQALQRQKSKIAVELEKKVRSSGYGNPVNPRLRPVALKPRSATISSSFAKPLRNLSAKSSKSSTLDLASFSREDSKPIADGHEKGKWELIPTTIKEEANKSEMTNGNDSLKDEDPNVKTSSKSDSSTNTSKELAKIHEMLREESTHSDLLSQTQLQLRLSSIKKKVEVRKRGRDSRSSYGSDLDDSMMDLTTDRDLINTSKTNRSTRASARSNITRISKQFQSSSVDL